MIIKLTTIDNDVIYINFNHVRYFHFDGKYTKIWYHQCTEESIGHVVLESSEQIYEILMEKKI